MSIKRVGKKKIIKTNNKYKPCLRDITTNISKQSMDVFIISKDPIRLFGWKEIIILAKAIIWKMLLAFIYFWHIFVWIPLHSFLGYNSCHFQVHFQNNWSLWTMKSHIMRYFVINNEPDINLNDNDNDKRFMWNNICQIKK